MDPYRGELRGLEVGEAERGHVLVLLRELGQAVNHSAVISDERWVALRRTTRDSAA